MCVRYLGFILLIWFPGALRAQSAAQSCSAPRLDGGFFAPKQQTYSYGTKLTYSCVEGRKPAVKGWWATSTCHNGKWSPEPQCIESINACGEPPKIPHALIIHQEYQEVFAANSEVQYQCEDGYTVEGADTTKSIFCIYGNWTEGPTCKSSSTSGSNERTSRPQITTVDHCGAYPNVPNGDVVERDQTFLKFQCNAFYTQVGLGTVVCYSDGTWSQLPICKEAFCVLDPAEHVGANFRLSGGMETEPGAGQNGSAEVGTAGVNTTSTGSGIHPEGGGSRPGTGHDGSAGSASSAEEKEIQLQFTTIRTCGNYPVVPNGDVVENNTMFLRYQCAAFYKQTGPEIVVCYSNRKWSETPTCKAAFCSVDTGDYPQLIPAGVKSIKEGEKARLECVRQDGWWMTHYSVVRCNNGRIRLSRCCDWWDLKRDMC